MKSVKCTINSEKFFTETWDMFREKCSPGTQIAICIIVSQLCD